MRPGGVEYVETIEWKDKIEMILCNQVANPGNQASDYYFEFTHGPSNTVTKFNKASWPFANTSNDQILSGTLPWTDLTSHLTSPITKIKIWQSGGSHQALTIGGMIADGRLLVDNDIIDTTGANVISTDIPNNKMVVSGGVWEGSDGSSTLPPAPDGTNIKFVTWDAFGTWKTDEYRAWNRRGWETHPDDASITGNFDGWSGWNNIRYADGSPIDDIVSITIQGTSTGTCKINNPGTGDGTWCNWFS